MKTVYTVITNDYDRIRPPEVISEGWQYICVSDKDIGLPFPWEPRIIGNTLDRNPKILGHLLFSGLTLYIDGNIQIIGDLNKLIKEEPLIDTWFCIRKHPKRDCIYDEAKAIKKLKLATKRDIRKAMKDIRMPRHWGLGANGIMLRDFDNPFIREICHKWWDYFDPSVGRDQLFLMPAFFDLKANPFFFEDNVTNRYFKFHPHNEENTYRSSLLA